MPSRSRASAFTPSKPSPCDSRTVSCEGEGEDAEPAPTPVQVRQLINKTMALFAREEELVREGVYDWRAFEFENPVRHLRSLIGVFGDGAGMHLRRHRKQNKVFGKRADVSGLPEYYLRNFHFQTDGYLSEDSARRYDHQVEILFNGTGGTMRRRVIPLLKRFADPKERWLDLGCGVGSATRAVAATFSKTNIVGVDLSNPYLKVAHDKLRAYPRVTFMQGDGTDLAFKDETFGAVFSIYCLHELPKVEREKFIREAYRVLKPGGVLIMADSLQNGDDPDVDFLLDRFPRYFHEPFFKNYVQNKLETFMAGLSTATPGTDLAMSTKFVYLTKPAAETSA